MILGKEGEKMRNKQQFHGDKKLPMNSLLGRAEKKLINATVHKFPTFIEGYHLTLMTILWSIGLVVFGYLAQFNINWLWMSSLMLFLQWFTDSYDGALGRYRDTGIPKWGYYMDHFLDYVFICSLLAGYTFLLSGIYKYMLFMLIPVSGAFMVSSFLSFAATNEFKITYLGMGPTEMRIVFIILNSLIMGLGTGFMLKALPYILVTAAIIMCVVVYRTDRLSRSILDFLRLLERIEAAGVAYVSVTESF